MKDFNSKNSLCRLLKIRYPIIQGGMIWVAGHRLASACSEAGILGVIGAASMSPALLCEHIKKTMSVTQNPFAVNIPLLYYQAAEQIKVSLGQGVKIFITSAGSPGKWTKFLQGEGAKVIHVVSHPRQAKKCEDLGVDAVVAEGFEAGGHNGRDELTTFTLIPQVVDAVSSIPIVAAGGIADARGYFAARFLGASGIQMGSRFVCVKESSAHQNFKDLITSSGADATMLSMKDIVPVRLLKNKFFKDVQELESKGASHEELIKLLGKGRAKQGMFEGELDEGELEIGQIAGIINNLPSVSDFMNTFITDVEAIHGEYANQNPWN